MDMSEKYSLLLYEILQNNIGLSLKFAIVNFSENPIVFCSISYSSKL